MKRKLTIVLMTLMIMATVVYAAQEDYTILVNGTPLKCNIPPRVVNGYILVPFRTIAEALGVDIHYDSSTNIIYVNSKPEEKPELPQEQPELPLFAELVNRYWTETDLETPPIDGPDDFKKFITEALEVLKNKTPNEYRIVLSYVKNIKLGKADTEERYDAAVVSDGTVIFNTDSYNMWINSRCDKEWLAKNAAALLVHEATHMQQNVCGMSIVGGTQFTKDDIELMAYLAQYRATQKLGLGKEAEKEMWKHVEEHLKK
ncbi:copper amine oxidase N-terminal domain-containing protein [Biomaibacter acetigenes]|uniref:Copper amine oxidase N-terminal domain-containing protein n=1 Tax=Biomaibacter acetigenes TaxID=2316383 RepID=A0A3G2R5W0_9FIRM|nr:stalk domain-containing protein [Biomaibacter acetigenes]AYO30850.1 copper amine oxidase N-terminal domain-containing protein [Biomaibacter acetigenes]